MFNRIRSKLGGRDSDAPSTNRLRGAFATDAGMHCLWRPAAFADVRDYDAWERQLGEDADILRHIAAGDVVPINIGADGAFEIEVRVGSADSPAILSGRERAYLDAESRPYRFTSDGELRLSGIEHVCADPGAHVGRLALVPGEYSVVVRLISWDREPGMRSSDGRPSPGALPDFVVTVNPASDQAEFRADLRTFSRSP